MTRRALLVTALATSVITLAGCGTAATPAESSAVAGPHWSYDGADGPTQWSTVSPEYAACSSGALQSPVDLTADVRASVGSVEIDAQPTSGVVIDTGHATQLTADNSSSTVALNEKRYQLAQLHVHTPAEHTSAGTHFDAEIHLVHDDGVGNLFVLGVLVREGDPSAAWQPFVDSAASAPTDSATLDLATALPNSLDYYGYLGSLTTPPCTENVQWIVLSTPIELSAEQIDTFAAVHGDNARPAQSLDGRTVSGGSATSGGE